MILCNEIIWTGKTTSTYCMREHGHAGEHSIENCKSMKHELVKIGSINIYDPALPPGVALCSCGAKSHPMYEGQHDLWVRDHAR